jgi:hypothetical protein
MVAQSESFSCASSECSLSSQSNSEAPLPPDFLSQSLRAFKEWRASLGKRSDGFQGNFVAIPKIDSKTGIVSIAEANVFNTGETGPGTQVSLGVKGTMSKFVHGSIIALHNPARNCFLKMSTLRASARLESLERLSQDGETELFLVLDLGRGHFSLYSVAYSHLLGFYHADQVFGYWPVAELSSIDDRQFLAEIPDAAVFIVQPQRSDGSTISLYSKCTKSFLQVSGNYFLGGSTGTSADEEFQVLVVMDAEKLTGVNHCPSHPSTSSVMQQSYDAFVEWSGGLQSFGRRLDGNLMATTREVSVSGYILPPKTEILRGDMTNSHIQLGKVTSIGNLSDGNVVALHSVTRNAFLEINGNRAQVEPTPRNAGNLPLSSDLGFFLVTALGDDRFSFYSITHDQFLVVKVPHAVIGIQRKLNLGRHKLTDETFLDQIPTGAYFTVKSEKSDGSVVSLYSEASKSYITASGGTTIDATATSPGEEQLFQIVLLMKIQRKPTVPSGG